MMNLVLKFQDLSFRGKTIFVSIVKRPGLICMTTVFQQQTLKCIARKRYLCILEQRCEKLTEQQMKYLKIVSSLIAIVHISLYLDFA
jgi:hypothetical protein